MLHGLLLLPSAVSHLQAKHGRRLLNMSDPDPIHLDYAGPRTRGPLESWQILLIVLVTMLVADVGFLVYGFVRLSQMD
jgi:hypothetical protein